MWTIAVQKRSAYIATQIPTFPQIPQMTIISGRSNPFVQFTDFNQNAYQPIRDCVSWGQIRASVDFYWSSPLMKCHWISWGLWTKWICLRRSDSRNLENLLEFLEIMEIWWWVDRLHKPVLCGVCSTCPNLQLEGALTRLKMLHLTSQARLPFRELPFVEKSYSDIQNALEC